MRFQKKLRLVATPFVASAMIVTLGGCFYGGHGDHRMHDRGYHHDDRRHDEGMRYGPTVNHLTGTVAAATINAPAKVALVFRHPVGQ
jgi:hypothetical protein